MLGLRTPDRIQGPRLSLPPVAEEDFYQMAADDRGWGNGCMPDAGMLAVPDHEAGTNMPSKIQSEQVFGSLRADILACRLEPGAKLRINEIAEAEGVSLGAVREALSRLGAEGLVVPEAQKGYRVTPLSIEELLDLTEARVEIERIALMRSIERGDLDWETSLVGAWHKLSRLDQRVRESGQQIPDREVADQWYVAHSGFHQALVAACGSEKLLQIRFRLYEQAERYRRYSAPIASEKKRDVAAEHEGIFNACMARDAPLAGQLIADHLRRTASLLTNSPRLVAEDALPLDLTNEAADRGYESVAAGQREAAEPGE
jgi:GntR family transcriptional regulator, carbon starvation induced regulator